MVLTSWGPGACVLPEDACHRFSRVLTKVDSGPGCGGVASFSIVFYNLSKVSPHSSLT